MTRRTSSSERTTASGRQNQKHSGNCLTSASARAATSGVTGAESAAPSDREASVGNTLQRYDTARVAWVTRGEPLTMGRREVMPVRA
jgi:hypothetical protein